MRNGKRAGMRGASRPLLSVCLCSFCSVTLFSLEKFLNFWHLLVQTNCFFCEPGDMARTPMSNCEDLILSFPAWVGERRGVYCRVCCRMCCRVGFLSLLLYTSTGKQATRMPINKSAIKDILGFYNEGLKAESRRLPLFGPVGPVDSKEILSLFSVAQKSAASRR